MSGEVPSQHREMHDKGAPVVSSEVEPEGYEANIDRAQEMAIAGDAKETLAVNFRKYPEKALSYRRKASDIEEDAGKKFDESNSEFTEEVFAEIEALVDSGKDITVGGLALVGQEEGPNDRKKKMIETALGIDPANGRGFEGSQNVFLSNISGIVAMYNGLMSVTFRKDLQLYNRIKQEFIQSGGQ
ncbi:MAG: hypothetical protein WC451_04080 [Patescibacteria group bacterium]